MLKWKQFLQGYITVTEATEVPEVPQDKSRRAFFVRGVKTAAALGMVSGLTYSNQGVGEKGQVDKIDHELSGRLSRQHREELSDNLAEVNEGAANKMVAGAAVFAPSAVVYTAIAATEKIKEKRDRQRQAGEGTEVPVSRRKFLRSATEMAAGAAAFVTTSNAIQNGSGYARARDAQKMLPSSLPEEDRQNLLRALKEDEAKKYAGIFDSLLITSGAAVIAHAERVAREREQAEEEAKHAAVHRL